MALTLMPVRQTPTPGSSGVRRVRGRRLSIRSRAFTGQRPPVRAQYRPPTDASSSAACITSTVPRMAVAMRSLASLTRPPPPTSATGPAPTWFSSSTLAGRMGKRDSLLVSNRDLAAGVRGGLTNVCSGLLSRSMSTSAFDRDGGFVERFRRGPVRPPTSASRTSSRPPRGFRTM